MDISKILQPAALGTPHRRLFFTLLLSAAIIFLLSRFQFLLYNYQLDLNETLQLTAALRLHQDWIPWRSDALGTSGPLAPGLLAILNLCGLPSSYKALHGLAIVLHLGTFILGLAVARRFTDASSALLAFLACTLWMASCTQVAYTHFAPELLPCFIIASGLLILVGNNAHATGVVWKLSLGCFVIGLSPWANFQATPIALGICLWVVASIIIGQVGQNDPTNKYLKLTVALTASVIPTLAILILSFVTGSFEDLWHNYFVSSISGTQSTAASQPVSFLADSMETPWTLGLFITGLLSIVFASRELIQREHSLKLLLCLILLSSAIISIILPGYYRPDFQNLLILPTELGLALAISFIRTSLSVPSTLLQRRAFAACLVFASGQPLVRSVHSNWSTYQCTATAPTDFGLTQKLIKNRAQAIIPPNDSLFIWGSAPSLYIDLNAHQATRYSDYYIMVKESPARDFQRERCMQDLLTAKPNWIISPDLGISFPKGSIKPFPELQKLLDDSYSIVYRDELMIIYQKKS